MHGGLPSSPLRLYLVAIVVSIPKFKFCQSGIQTVIAEFTFPLLQPPCLQWIQFLVLRDKLFEPMAICPFYLLTMNMVFLDTITSAKKGHRGLRHNSKVVLHHLASSASTTKRTSSPYFWRVQSSAVVPQQGQTLQDTILLSSCSGFRGLQTLCSIHSKINSILYLLMPWNYMWTYMIWLPFTVKLSFHLSTASAVSHHGLSRNGTLPQRCWCHTRCRSWTAMLQSFFNSELTPIFRDLISQLATLSCGTAQVQWWKQGCTCWHYSCGHLPSWEILPSCLAVTFNGHFCTGVLPCFHHASLLGFVILHASTLLSPCMSVWFCCCCSALFPPFSTQFTFHSLSAQVFWECFCNRFHYFFFFLLPSQS